MSRNTLDIDTPLLSELKRLQADAGKTLGQLVSELVAEALSSRTSKKRPSEPSFNWIARPMRARVDIEDKEALRAALDSAGDGDH
ncbi:MAG: hypothetical protein RL199_1718 [Pseudomonadota bacterium]